MSSLPFNTSGGRRQRHRKRGKGTPLTGPNNLSKLAVGDSGTVMTLMGDRRLRRRLMEMGIIEGSKVRVVKFAPAGDPMEIQLNDYFLSLRRHEAERIIVNLDGPKPVE